MAALLVGAVVLVRRLPRYRRREAVAALVSLALTVSTVACALRPSPSWTAPTGLRVTFLDVGQGDSALVEAPGAAATTIQVPGGGWIAQGFSRASVTAARYDRMVTVPDLGRPQEGHHHHVGEKIPIPDTPYDTAFWGDEDDRGVAG